MRTMKTYNILIKQGSSKKIEDVAVIKEGFSITAFLFGVFWFLYHRMFKEVLILIVVVFLIQQFTKISSDFDKVAIEMVLAIVIAFNANFWLANKYKNNDYEFVGLVHCDNIEEARMEAIKDLDKRVFSDKYIDPMSDKTPHFLKKLYKFLNKIR